ncbi:hypothetical protein B0H12DRAFT_1096793 [Mycena haematopus]|nr:hypothetical protein B0H12DRAFT_1096793 [Mycena haematopus]
MSKPRGLLNPTNPGNTCFLNSTLQVLRLTKGLLPALAAHKCNTRGCILCTIAATFIQITEGGRPIVPPIIKSWPLSGLPLGLQHDAHECVIQLLDNINICICL